MPDADPFVESVRSHMGNYAPPTSSEPGAGLRVTSIDIPFAQVFALTAKVAAAGALLTALAWLVMTVVQAALA